MRVRAKPTSGIWGRREARHSSTDGGGFHSMPAATTPLRETRPLEGPSQDRALYACGCGYRFDALVSTSVACPRCGGPQAW